MVISLIRQTRNTVYASLQWQIFTTSSASLRRRRKKRGGQTHKLNIGGVIVSVLVSSAVDRGGGFEARSDQTKDYKLGVCCFLAKHAALRRKSKDWLSRNQENLLEWSDMSVDCCFSELALNKSISGCWYITKPTSSHRNVNNAPKKYMCL